MITVMDYREHELFYHHKKVDFHKGFDIIYYTNTRKATEYYYISKDGDRQSILALASPKACINVINTFLRSNNQ